LPRVTLAEMLDDLHIADERYHATGAEGAAMMELDGCIVLNEHNTVLGSKRLAICATVYVGVQR